MPFSIKQRAFSALFGWWTPRELLFFKGCLEEEDKRFENPERLLQDAVLAVHERDAATAALFDFDQADDDEVDAVWYACLAALAPLDLY